MSDNLPAGYMYPEEIFKAEKEFRNWRRAYPKHDKEGKRRIYTNAFQIIQA
jgi:hypothetical protein